MIGTVLSGRYKLEAKLGSGGMSTVYLARDTTLDRQVAVKVMHREMSEQADQLQRFRQEARAVAKLSHPNVVAVIDAGEDGGHPYIVFEYVEGETLKQRPRRAGGARLRDRDRPRTDRRPRPQHGPPRHQAPERPHRF
jgi:serine/threonine protein kinase